MANIATFSKNIDFAEVMVTTETAKLLRCSRETVRQLTERPWHPLPCADLRMGQKRQRLFRRTTVLRWLAEEEENGAPATGLPPSLGAATTSSQAIRPASPARADTSAPGRRGRGRPRKTAAEPAIRGARAAAVTAAP
jgi:Helix-turn-helix domain